MDTAEVTPEARRGWRGWRRKLGTLILLCLALLPLTPSLTSRALNRLSAPASPVSDAALKLHRGLFVADLHADSLLWSRDLLERGEHGHVDLPRMLEGGVGLQAFTIVTKLPLWPGFEDQPIPPDVTARLLAITQGWPTRTWTSLVERALYQSEKLHALARRSEGRFRVIETRAQLEEYVASRARDPAQSAGILGVEGAHCLEGRLENLDRLHAAGVRMLAPTHFFDTELGGSAHGESGAGLSDFGRRVIEGMEQLGMVIDVAHASPALIADIAAIAKGPLVASHTGVKGTHDSPRNLSDAELRLIADSGGVIGVAFFAQAIGGANLDAVVRAIRYCVDRVGVDAVALGSDFDGAVSTPIDASGFPQLTTALLAAGFNERDLRKIMGDNVLRVLRRSLPVATEASSEPR